MDEDARNPEDVRVGATIRALREAYGLSLEELGRAIEKSSRYLRYIEAGDKPAGIILCRQIANAIGVPLAAITMPNYSEIADPASRRRAGAEDAA